MLDDELVNQYFFSKLDQPDWISALLQKDFFQTPPQAEKVGQSLHFSHWPQSQYLVRMTKFSPESVAEIIFRVPETDNERVHEGFVEAAIAMPAEFAIKIAKSELRWIQSQEQFYFLYPDYIGKLISHMAKSGKIRVASELTKSLLAISKVEREIGAPGDEWYHKSVEIIAKFSTWEYGRILEKNIPDLLSASGMVAFDLLCGLLETAMDLERTDAPNDYSWIWRSAIEDHEQNTGGEGDIKSILVVAVRDAAVQLVASDGATLPEIVSCLESRDWIIFKRLSLYLLSQFPEKQPDLVAERLSKKGLFENHGCRHEYAQLARSGFGTMSPEQKEAILSWIEDGPDVDGFKARFLESQEQEATVDEIKDWIKRWQRDRLDQFKESLPKDWQRRFEALVQKFGEAEHPEFASYSTSWTGPTSPKTLDELKQLSVDEVVLFLREWKPPKNEMDHSPEGLSRMLTDAVSADPIRYAEEAEKFISLDPTYVRGVVNGLTNAAKSNSDFPWGSVLKLCRWVVDQPREIPGRKSEYSDIDPGWVWARKSIASLLSNGLKSCPGELPFEFRQQAWNVILPLTDDPDPADEKYGKGEMDPSTLSINSVRGEAMHAVVNYALWVFRNTEGDEKSFDMMPEVRGVLDNHLDSDESLAIHSIYGQWFPWLHLMDKAWAKKTREEIFPPNSAQYWDAAWKTYITFCQPYDDMLTVLRDQYALAIDKIGQPSDIEIDMANAEKRLSDHLLTFYWRGKLEIDDPLIQSLYAQATEKMKAHAVEFFGRSLRNMPDDIQPEAHERLVAFWAWRFEVASENEKTDELADFCWWFASGKMDADWALAQLKAVLNLSIKLDALNFAAEELVKLMSDKPAAVLKCLNLMVGHLSGEGIYFHWNNEAKQILAETMQMEDAAVNALATGIIHQLGAMGYFEYRELLG